MPQVPDELLNDPEHEGWVNQYNTQLSPAQENSFNVYLAEQKRWTGRDYSNDLQNYDLRGWWVKHRGGRTPSGHFEDTFKKPNHPTFSVQSKYHGQEGYEGGVWSPIPGQRDAWTFTPGGTNLNMWGPAALTDYFRKVEPRSRLILPRQKLVGNE